VPSPDQILNQKTHRPWDTPRRPWLWSQKWRNLLFAHWSVPEDALRPHVPGSLEIDTKDGATWVSAVAFHMARVRPRWLPPLPPVSDFLELNFRTYVRFDGKPGVFFLSIHASKRLAVQIARWFSPLPYVYARMECSQEKGEHRFQCASVDREGAVAFTAEYTPQFEVYAASRGSLSEWLLERYCLYAGTPSGRLVSTEVHHAPWAVQDVTVEIASNTLGRPFGLDLSPRPDRAHFSCGVNALAWPFEHMADDFTPGCCRR
jgi:uncharacterized protein